MEQQQHYDVLVVGAGLAGCMAALSAAEAGAQVALACASSLFSGCSFFGGTWGLGLIAPADEADEADLARTICEIGGGAANPQLVRSFTAGIRPAIERLESYGVELLRPQHGAEREYVACFDGKVRAWHGIRRDAFSRAIGARLRAAGVQVLEGCELLQICRDGQEASGSVYGGWFYCSDSQAFSFISCKALVLATGGVATLFGRRLAPDDCLATGQALALEAGARTVNLEFLQFMPGLVSPVRNVVFNEKTFRFCKVQGLDGRDPSVEHALDARSGYGPFTMRLAGRVVDAAIADAGDEGLSIQMQVPEGGEDELPEFVRTYFTWLRDSYGLAADEPVRVAHYAHAANGGIAIDQQAATDVPGLFAAGEATGGMHGADRIGGLSSANCLVFGLRAGASAADFASDCDAATDATRNGEISEIPAWQQRACADVAAIEETLHAVMDASCGVRRTREGLQDAHARLIALQEKLDKKPAGSSSEHAAPVAAACVATRRAALRVATAIAFVEAALAREESLGSHYRADSSNK